MASAYLSSCGSNKTDKIDVSGFKVELAEGMTKKDHIWSQASKAIAIDKVGKTKAGKQFNLSLGDAKINVSEVKLVSGSLDKDAKVEYVDGTIAINCKQDTAKKQEATYKLHIDFNYNDKNYVGDSAEFKIVVPPYNK